MKKRILCFLCFFFLALIHCSYGEEGPRVEQFSPQGTVKRILYPPQGTIIALDPDIPAERQKVFFFSQADESSCRWVLNGKFLGPGRSIPWTPQRGNYLLSIADREGKRMDSVQFQVRGTLGEDPGKETDEAG
jgi:penicillin-binding protein 1C